MQWNTAKLSEYPFLSQAAEYVAGLETPVDHYLTARTFEMARYRAQTRVLQAIGGEIKRDNTINGVTELFSYPIARILVSCIDDAFLTRRYALKEAEFSNVKMKQEDNYEILQEIGRDFDIAPSINDKGFQMHFTDYVRCAAGMRALKWKLVNRRLESGFVNITKEEYTRLLQEVIKERLLKLPLEVPDRFCQSLMVYIDEIKTSLEASKSEFDEAGFGNVEPEHFPPCIRHLLANAQGGMAHSARFALTSFLLKIGLSVDQIVHMFNVSPDFNEETTRYQIEHIAGSTGTFYIPPSCTTMNTYGNCFGKDELCRTIYHPLTYYKKKKIIQSPQPDTASPKKTTE
jgi:DNA primase large subunit